MARKSIPWFLKEDDDEVVDLVSQTRKPRSIPVWKQIDSAFENNLAGVELQKLWQEALAFDFPESEPIACNPKTGLPILDHPPLSEVLTQNAFIAIDSPDLETALSVLQASQERLYCITESGAELTEDEIEEHAGEDGFFTVPYVADPSISGGLAQLHLDLEGTFYPLLMRKAIYVVAEEMEKHQLTGTITTP